MKRSRKLFQYLKQLKKTTYKVQISTLIILSKQFTEIMPKMRRNLIAENNNKHTSQLF
jgi:hypothetical protein